MTYDTNYELPEHRRRVEAWREWLPKRFRFNTFGTLHFNQGEVSLVYARKRLFRFLTDIQKRPSMFGEKFYEIPWQFRIDGVIVPELINSSTHYHFLLQIPDSKIQTFYELGETTWKKVTESGKFWSKKVLGEDHWRRIISYATKETHKDENYGNLILVRECWHQ